jgi:hypothetical protein
MKPSLIGSDQKVLQEYLQDLICNVNSVEEVDVLVEALMSLQHATRPISAKLTANPLRIVHGRPHS